jgi:hypothetical protein
MLESPYIKFSVKIYSVREVLMLEFKWIYLLHTQAGTPLGFHETS